MNSNQLILWVVITVAAFMFIRLYPTPKPEIKGQQMKGEIERLERELGEGHEQMSSKVEQLQQLLVKVATALQMEDATDFTGLVARAEYLCVVEEASNALRAQMAGMYKQLRKCKSCTPDKPQKCTTCDHNFQLRRKEKEDE